MLFRGFIIKSRDFLSLIPKLHVLLSLLHLQYCDLFLFITIYFVRYFTFFFIITFILLFSYLITTTQIQYSQCSVMIQLLGYTEEGIMQVRQYIQKACREQSIKMHVMVQDLSIVDEWDKQMILNKKCNIVAKNQSKTSTHNNILSLISMKYCISFWIKLFSLQSNL